MTVKQPQVSFITLGCAKNEADSAAMERKLIQAGFKIIDAPNDADAVIVNTCSFIQAATEESLDTIFEVADMPDFKKRGGKLIVAGCMPARYGEDLESELSEASTFVPCSKEDDIARILLSLYPAFAVERALMLANGASQAGGISESPDHKITAPENLSVYVKISDGCNRFCSFCTIPFIRGRYHSFTFEDIDAEVRSSIERGAREIVLIAQDTGRWGDDFDKPSSLAELMDKLATKYQDTWFRVMYIQPEGINDELLKVIASHDNICKYLDIPLQHSEPHILKAMNRKGSAQSYLEMADHIRNMVPGVTLRTTMIAGFPGESEEDFDALLNFIEELDFDYVGVFPYSQEEGTRAARLDNQIDEDTKLERAQQVRDLADSISCAKVAERQGKDFDVLVLGCEEDGQLYGRAMCQAPDVDGVTYLSEGTPGEIVRVRIGDTLAYEMESE